MEIHNSRMANEVMRQCVLTYDPQLAPLWGQRTDDLPLLSMARIQFGAGLGL
jgi:hypothetical protein